MKKTLLSLVFFVSSLFCFGQSSGEHLKFMGIPIDGTLESFVAKLKGKGMEADDPKDGKCILMGDFAGNKDCYIAVVSDEKTKLVYNVGVCLPDNDSWKSLKLKYDYLKSLLMKKYGVPSEETEGFTGKKPSDDNSKLNAVKEKRSNYRTAFYFENGDILMELSYSNTLGFYVLMQYRDWQNYSKREDKILDDL